MPSQARNLCKTMRRRVKIRRSENISLISLKKILNKKKRKIQEIQED
jgi:hypothetical protein